jgi:hypothetical protein
MEYLERQLSEGNRTALYTVCEHTVTYYHSLIKKEAGRREFRPISPEARRKSAEEGVKTIFEKVLSTILPETGKPINDSTREEIMEFRGYLTNLINKLKPGQTPRQANITEF